MNYKSESKINQSFWRVENALKKENRWIIWPVWCGKTIIINRQQTKWQVNSLHFVEERIICWFVNNVLDGSCSSPVAWMNQWISVVFFWVFFRFWTENKSFVIESKSTIHTITNNKHMVKFKHKAIDVSDSYFNGLRAERRKKKRKINKQTYSI